MKTQHGFTLIEVLVVLAIWSIIMLLSAPLNVSVLEKQKEKQFMETLLTDILYLQNLSYGSRYNYRLKFNDNNTYVINKINSDEYPVERSIPEGWKVDIRTLPAILFNRKGTIIEAGNFKINTLHSSYKLICPLGKGRCYISEQ